MTRYGLQGVQSRELMSFGGRVVIHDNFHELEWINNNETYKVVELPRDIPEEQTFPYKLLPENVGINWPLRREDFR